MEGFGAGHIVYRFVHRLDHGGNQRARHVADAHADDLCFGMCFCKRLRALADFVEEITTVELRVKTVCSKQNQASPLSKSRHYII